MRWIFAAALLIAFSAIQATPAEARCGFGWQKDSRGHSCGGRSHANKHYKKLSHRRVRYSSRRR